MKPSPVTICNQALLWLGQDKINSLDEQSTTAEWCLNNYDQLRAAVLEERMWTFNTARVTSTSQAKDDWGERFVHPMPTDWTNVWQVYIRPPIGSSSIGELDKSWRREGDKILSYWETIFMKGSVELTDESKFTPMFVQALAARIAADAAIPFTENAKLQADMWSLYEGKLSAAAARDGQQGANDVIKQTLLIGSRYSDGIGER